MAANSHFIKFIFKSNKKNNKAKCVICRLFAAREALIRQNVYYSQDNNEIQSNE